MAVICPKCGAGNPDGYTNCYSCRAELASAGHPASQGGDRRCVACGRELAWDANVCPYCGKVYRYGLPDMHETEPIGTGMKIILYLLAMVRQSRSPILLP